MVKKELTAEQVDELKVKDTVTEDSGMSYGTQPSQLITRTVCWSCGAKLCNEPNMGAINQHYVDTGHDMFKIDVRK